jgi:DNA polymerase/3'-5' exonuclease PolX
MATRLNGLVADRLREAADLLEQQNANPFRVRAYRSAADTVAGLAEDIEQIAGRAGMDGLVALPQVGKGIAAAILEILHTGRWSQIDRLRGVLDPQQLFETVPGVGPELARRIHDHLHVDTPWRQRRTTDAWSRCPGSGSGALRRSALRSP